MTTRKYYKVEQARHTCNKPEVLAHYLSEDDIRWLWRRRYRHQQCAGSLSICDSISHGLANKTCYEFMSGEYHDDQPRPCYYHCWVVTADHVIIDASADQFGLHGVMVIEPGDPEYTRYKSPKLKGRGGYAQQPNPWDAPRTYNESIPGAASLALLLMTP